MTHPNPPEVVTQGEGPVEVDRFSVLAKAVKSVLPIGDATKPDSAVFPIYVRMSELRALHTLCEEFSK